MKFLDMFSGFRNSGKGWDYSGWSRGGRNIYFIGKRGLEGEQEKIYSELMGLVDEKKISSIYFGKSFGGDSLEEFVFSRLEASKNGEIKLFDVDNLYLVEDQDRMIEFHNSLLSYPDYFGKDFDLFDAWKSIESILDLRGKSMVEKVEKNMIKNNYLSSALVFELLGTKGIGFADYNF